MDNRLIFDKSTTERRTIFFPQPLSSIKEANQLIPEKFLRHNLNLPSLGELDVVRHYTNLSRLNFCVDTNFYPLGSCTMKYNPKINENVSRNEGFVYLHPYQDEQLVQGALQLLYELEKILCAITGMNSFTLQPAAGAHGELTGMLIIKAYHKHNRKKRYKVIVPDSAHGTNLATSGMCGYKVVTIKSTQDGLVDIDKLNNNVDDSVAAMMLTNPNTLGLFEERILDISDILHKKGALMYYDGANFNALLGKALPSAMGFDIIHLNFHKTFSTPHGGGGPGAAAVGTTQRLKSFLPIPQIDKKGDKFYLNYRLEHTIGRVRSFYGNFSILVRAYAYLLRLGKEGLIRVAENSVLNAIYIREKLKKYYTPASPRKCMHEVVFSCAKQKEKNIRALDIAKRLIDFGIHPPTMYFPSIVKEALMIEPTETESKETLDYFIQTMIKINTEVEADTQKLKQAPLTTILRHVDETRAARYPNLRWKDPGA